MKHMRPFFICGFALLLIFAVSITATGQDQDEPQLNPSQNAPVAPEDQQILDDLVVYGSLCTGLDCVNGEHFSFDTIRLKENNLRIHFQDTSNSASFPTNDWRISIQ